MNLKAYHSFGQQRYPEKVVKGIAAIHGLEPRVVRARLYWLTFIQFKDPSAPEEQVCAGCKEEKHIVHFAKARHGQRNGSYKPYWASRCDKCRFARMASHPDKRRAELPRDAAKVRRYALSKRAAEFGLPCLISTDELFKFFEGHGYRCQAKLNDGNYCYSQWLTGVQPILPFACGGTCTIENMTIRCKACLLATKRGYKRTPVKYSQQRQKRGTQSPKPRSKQAAQTADTESDKCPSNPSLVPTQIH